MRMRSRPVQRAPRKRSLGGYVSAGQMSRPRCPPLFGGARCQGDYVRHAALGDVPIPGSQPPFPDSVEVWRPLITAQCQGTGINPDFALAWVDLESTGYPCATGGLSNPEGGIFQLMGPDQAGTNVAAAGTTSELQHPTPPCKYSVASGKGDYTPFSALSSAQQFEQVRAGIQYIQACMTYANAHLAANGYTWDPSTTDYWTIVKYEHIGPGYTNTLLQQGVSLNDGTPPADFPSLLATGATGGVNAATIAHTQAVGAFGVSDASDIVSDLGIAGLAGLFILGGVLWYFAFGDEVA